MKECKGAARLKGSSLRKYWWDLPMEASKEEDSGLSGLGAFFGRSEGVWRRRHQSEELEERGIFIREFAEGAQVQAVGNAPPTHQDPPTAVPLPHCTALSEPQPPVALPTPVPPTFCALPPLTPHQYHLQTPKPQIFL